jgi:2-oxo-4-hydroxy-4-carboxy-5-ureidoimidazoline decarboxylase
MTLHDLNSLPTEQLKTTLMKCCGCKAWVDKMLPLVPFEDLVELIETAEEQWYLCNSNDWKEAFSHHPRIGETGSLKEKFGSTAEWAAEEQSGTRDANEYTLNALSAANKKYEDKFGYTFIVYASGKTADEMLGILSTRLRNDDKTELGIAAEEQNKIIRHRLEKLLA